MKHVITIDIEKEIALAGHFVCPPWGEIWGESSMFINT